MEALLIKQDGEWKIIMENQKDSVSEAEWDQLK
jgi:hypothetical protein